jgi:ribose transport system substrate-binding protein
MAQKSVEIGNDILGGKKPANPVQLLTPTPITPDNLASYKGWSAPR